MNVGVYLWILCVSACGWMCECVCGWRVSVLVSVVVDGCVSDDDD